MTARRPASRAEVLTKIYGEEDWSATIRKVDDEADEADERSRTTSIPLEARQAAPRPHGRADAEHDAVTLDRHLPAAGRSRR